MLRSKVTCGVLRAGVLERLGVGVDADHGLPPCARARRSRSPRRTRGRRPCARGRAARSTRRPPGGGGTSSSLRGRRGACARRSGAGAGRRAAGRAGHRAGRSCVRPHQYRNPRPEGPPAVADLVERAAVAGLDGLLEARLALRRDVGRADRADQDQPCIERADARQLLEARVGLVRVQRQQRLAVELALQRRLGDAVQARDLVRGQTSSSWSWSSSSGGGNVSPSASRSFTACAWPVRAEMTDQAAASYGEWKSTGRR